MNERETVTAEGSLTAAFFNIENQQAATFLTIYGEKSRQYRCQEG